VCSIGLALCEGCSEAFDASVQAKRELVRSALRDTLPCAPGIWLAPADMDQSPSWEALALLESKKPTPGTGEDLSRLRAVCLPAGTPRGNSIDRRESFGPLRSSNLMAEVDFISPVPLVIRVSLHKCRVNLPPAIPEFGDGGFLRLLENLENIRLEFRVVHGAPSSTRASLRTRNLVSSRRRKAPNLWDSSSRAPRI